MPRRTSGGAVTGGGVEGEEEFLQVAPRSGVVYFLQMPHDLKKGLVCLLVPSTATHPLRPSPSLPTPISPLHFHELPSPAATLAARPPRTEALVHGCCTRVRMQVVEGQGTPEVGKSCPLIVSCV